MKIKMYGAVHAELRAAAVQLCNLPALPMGRLHQCTANRASRLVSPFPCHALANCNDCTVYFKAFVKGLCVYQFIVLGRSKL